MRLVLLSLLLIAPTVLAASEVLTFTLATEGTLGSHVFNLAVDTPVTVSRSGTQGALVYQVTSGISQARYIVDGETAFVPVRVTGAGHGAEDAPGTLLVDVTSGSAFRGSYQLAGLGTFAGEGTVAAGADIGVAAGVATLS